MNVTFTVPQRTKWMLPDIADLEINRAWIDVPIRINPTGVPRQKTLAAIRIIIIKEITL